MGIFTRVRDIMASNINAMLEKAEDPEKLIRLMIQEMEDTLVEVKASCAGAMADQKRVRRGLEGAAERRESWGGKAELAVEKGRDDLAREALLEKRRSAERVRALEAELTEHDSIVRQYKDEIVQLEEKLTSARERQRVLVQRHIHARRKRKVQEEIRRIDSSEAFARFERLENRIERMEADADLVNFGRKPSLEDEFAALEGGEEIERELASLKSSLPVGRQTGAPKRPATEKEAGGEEE